MEKFAIGLVFGGAIGAILTANNYKMRMLVKKGQEEALAKLNGFMDEKIEKMEEGAEKIKEQAETVKEKAEKKMKKTSKSKAKPAEKTAAANA